MKQRTTHTQKKGERETSNLQKVIIKEEEMTNKSFTIVSFHHVLLHMDEDE